MSKFGTVTDVNKDELLTAMVGTRKHLRTEAKIVAARLRDERNKKEGVMIVPIEKVKKRDFFRLPGRDRVYVAEGYCRFNKKYSGMRWDDINHYIYKRKGTLVEINFDF